MGFLNKLFGGANDKTAAGFPERRAQYKNRKYFDTLFRRQSDNVATSISNMELLRQQEQLTPYHYWAVGLDYLGKFCVAYSMGQPLERCYDIFTDAVKWYVQGWEPDSTYADMLEMVALGYLLQVPDSDYQGIARYVQNSDSGSDYPEWKPDAILWFIINAKIPSGSQPQTLAVRKIYSQLKEIISMNKQDAEPAMKQYLDGWYELHKDAPWYNGHIRNLDYRGYWAWEAGAVAKIMQLDDSSFKDNPYYPYDLVHWTNEQH